MKDKDLKKYIPYLFVLLVGAAAIVITLLITSPKEEGPAETEPSSSSEEEVFPTASALDIAKIDELMKTYYKAKIENDAETLNKIVDTETPYSVSELTSETQYISRYDSFYTYVIPGMSETDFIVYVTYDIFFRGIETGAPSLNHFVVIKAEDEYRINAKTLDDEFAEYVTRTENSQNAKALREEVDAKLKKACDTDPDLKELITLLSGGEPEETEATSAADTSDEADSSANSSAGEEDSAESTSETEKKEE